MSYTTYLEHQPHVKAFFDEVTNTISYVVTDTSSKKCAVIDSVLDYEPESATISYESAEKILAYIQEHTLKVEWILETHVHADHLTAAKYIQEKVGGKIGISEKIITVQEAFGVVFDEDKTFLRDGSQFDVLFKEDQTFFVGEIPARALYVPGHTPADVAFVIGDSVFAGDTIFMPDMGSARCDFPGGSASLLYESVQKVLRLPSEMKMYICHDYLPKGRAEYAWETTIKEEKQKNIHLAASIPKEHFITLREKRDKELNMPRLIIPALQVNMRGGDIPKNSNGALFLKIPVNSVFSK